MADTFSMIDNENIQVTSQTSSSYNINDLIIQANNITQNISILQQKLISINDLISGAQNSGISILTSNIVDQTQALPSGTDISTILASKTLGISNVVTP